jgi:cytochrome P450
MELLGFCIVLLAAGHETTTNLITNAMRALTEDPGRWQRLVENPEALSSTIEEVLRFYSPVQATNRIVTQKTQWQGCPLEPGQQMIVWLGSANRDPSVFANPDTFIATRHPNPHVGFGYGIHFCLGAALARAEAHIALTGMLQRFPNLQAIGSQQLSPIISGFVYGVESYQVKGTA